MIFTYKGLGSLRLVDQTGEDKFSARGGHHADHLDVDIFPHHFRRLVDNDHGAVTEVADGLIGFLTGLDKFDIELVAHGYLGIQ